MKLNKIAVSAMSFITMFLSLKAQAFTVDKMIIVSDDKGNGIVTLKNDEEQRIFVQSEIDEINIFDGDRIVKKLYERENLNDWKISLTHQKLVLNPGEEKDVGIRSLCHNTTCDDSKDLMFLLSFSPSKHRPGEMVSGIEVNYGFAPVYIIPTTKPNYSYKLINNGDSLRVENKSNTLINVFVNSCDAKNTTQCKQKFTVLAGRSKIFPLGENLQKNNITATVTSHDRSYSKKEIVTKG